MVGTLFVVATPIGNLEDITLRALRVLREASLIAAEDTRRTAKLLGHYGIHTTTLSFHAHNSRAGPETVDHGRVVGQRFGFDLRRLHGAERVEHLSRVVAFPAQNVQLLRSIGPGPAAAKAAYS